MKKLISKFNKKVAVILSLVMMLTTCNIGGLTNVYAASNPSFGSGAPETVTLYVNDNNNDSRAINIKINNWKSGYTYKAFSNNNSIATVKNGSVNSKSGVLFTIQAKSLGSTSVKVQMCKSGKVISTKTIMVYVKSRSMSTPSKPKLVSKTNNSIKISFSVSSTAYATGTYIQVSTSPNFSSAKTYNTTSIYKTTTVTLNNLSPGKGYYIRVASLSTLNGCALRSNWSSVLGTYTNLR